MTLSGNEIRAYCLDFPGAVEDFPFGPDVSTFKVEGKIFLLSWLSAPPPLQISLKCDPQIASGLRGAYPAIVAGYHLNKKHWNTVTLDGSLPEELVRGNDPGRMGSGRGFLAQAFSASGFADQQCGNSVGLAAVAVGAALLRPLGR